MPVLDNARHERFAQELAKGASQAEAYLAAGYKGDKTAASRLSTNVNVQGRVAELKSAIAERVEIDQSYVLSTILDTVERCKQAKPVFDRKGDPVLVETPAGDIAPAYIFDARSVLRGSELLGKHLGMFVERHEHTGKDGGPIETVDLTADEAGRRIAFTLANAAKDKSVTH